MGNKQGARPSFKPLPSANTCDAENKPAIADSTPTSTRSLAITPSKGNTTGKKPRRLSNATKKSMTATTPAFPTASASSSSSTPAPSQLQSTPTPCVSTLIQLEFWDVGSFSPYDSADTDAILRAFKAGQDTLVIGSMREIHDLQKLTMGETYQVNAETKRRRAVRVSPPYRYAKNCFSPIPIVQHKFEAKDRNVWKPVNDKVNLEISNAMESSPILQKTYISLGHKRTYAVVFSGSAHDKIHLVNEHNAQEPNIPIRQAFSRNHWTTHARSTGVSCSRAQPSVARGTSFRHQQTIDTDRAALKAKIDAAPPAPPLATIMSFTVGDEELDSEATKLLRSHVPNFPRPAVLKLTDTQVVEGFDKLEQNGASINGKPLSITFADTHAPIGQVVLPKDLEYADSININDLVTKIEPCAENCCICVDELSQDAVELKQCEHKFHSACLIEWFNTKMTCPMCNVQFGKLIGRQPENGQMQYYIDNGGIADSDKDTYIIARFEFPDGQDADGRGYAGRRETAFLHDNAEGRILLELFKIAFRRRVMFGLGENMRSQTYKPTFNVHIKTTRKDKGTAGHGYPDPDYFARTLDCLNANGVQIEDIYK